MRGAIVVAVALALGMSAAIGADPIGRYWSYWADPKSNTGQSGVVVHQTGTTYRVEYNDGSTGFAIQNKNFFVTLVTQKDWSGFSLLAEDGDGWTGPYAGSDGQPVGMERWDIANQNAKPPKLPPISAKVVGRYVMSGIKPDGSDYSGEVVIKRGGNALQVVRVIGDDQRIGAGLTYKDGFAVSYQDKDDKILQLLKVDGDGLTGFWSMVGDNQMGSERWVRWSQ